MKDENSYIEKLKEWQEHRYSPGHFLGGDIHPAYISRTRAGGIFLLICGAITFGLFIYGFIVDSQQITIGVIGVLIITILQIIVGFQFLNQNKK